MCGFYLNFSKKLCQKCVNLDGNLFAENSKYFAGHLLLEYMVFVSVFATFMISIFYVFVRMNFLIYF